MGEKSTAKAWKNPPRIYSNLSSFFFEFFLITLLFTHGIILYLIYKLTRYCKLRIPCMFCSTLKQMQEYFYKELICNEHKLEISSLTYYGSRDMCDGNSDSKFVNKIAKKSVIGKEQKCCSHCSVMLKRKPVTQKLFQSKNISEFDASSTGLDNEVTENLVYPSQTSPDNSVSSEHMGRKDQTKSVITKLEISSKDDYTTNEDLMKPLISDITIPLPSPRISDDLKSRITQITTPRSFNRNESTLEPFYENTIEEIEGESPFDRLKRQIEADRNYMSILYKELEEERNASAIAANQAMAMINRLQQEKAAMQMDALQYLRMMEEQSEYDQEAIQRLNELLTDREKEIQDLEAALENCKRGYVDYEEMESTGTPRVSRSNSGILDIEDERVYITACLKRLERMLMLYSESGDGPAWSQIGVGDSDSNSNSNSECDDSSIKETVICSIKGAIREKKLRSVSYNGRQLSTRNHKDEIAELGNEISQLNVRLKALEKDKKFLEHVVKSLKCGSGGMQILQEIANHLRELRRIGISQQED